MVGKNEVKQIVIGFSTDTEEDNCCIACGSVSLISSFNGQKILVDCGSPWHEQEIIEGLSANGIACSDITDVVITHGHSDHCGCLSLFKSARFFMDRDYAVKFCRYLEMKESTKIAPGVKIIRTPGHTDHDLSVVVDETSIGTVVAVGDIFENGEEDDWLPNSRYPELQTISREKILSIADWIVPGHGKIFKIFPKTTVNRAS